MQRYIWVWNCIVKISCWEDDIYSLRKFRKKIGGGERLTAFDAQLHTDLLKHRHTPQRQRQTHNHTHIERHTQTSLFFIPAHAHVLTHAYIGHFKYFRVMFTDRKWRAKSCCARTACQLIFCKGKKSFIRFLVFGHALPLNLVSHLSLDLVSCKEWVRFLWAMLLGRC